MCLNYQTNRSCRRYIFSNPSQGIFYRSSGNYSDFRACSTRVYSRIIVIINGLINKSHELQEFVFFFFSFFHVTNIVEHSVTNELQPVKCSKNLVSL